MKSFINEMLDTFRVIDSFVLRTLLITTYLFMVLITAIIIGTTSKGTITFFIVSIFVELGIYLPSAILIYWIFKDPYS
jgi:membrane protein insertase Oxa1/YidC/SpoIIIJ